MSKPRFKITATSKTGIGKKPRAKAFVQINISQREQSELRVLAKEFGMELRLFLRCAVNQYEREYRKLLATAKQAGISPLTLLQWSCNPTDMLKN